MVYRQEMVQILLVLKMSHWLMEEPYLLEADNNGVKND